MFRTLQLRILRFSISTSVVLFTMEALSQTAIAPQGAARSYTVGVEPKDSNDVLGKIVLTINRNGSKSTKLQLSNEIESVDGIYYTGDLFVALGSLMSHAGRSVTVVNGSSSTILFSDSCFNPVLSSDAKYIAYEEWYPRFPSFDTLWPGVYVLSISGAEKGPMRVFPLERKPQEVAASPVHAVVSPMIWSEDGKTLVFFDKYGPYGDWSLPYELKCVAVQIGDGNSPHIATAEVSYADFLVPNVKPESVGFYVEALRFEDKNSLVAKLHPQSYWKQDTFRFSLASLLKGKPLTPH